MANSLFSEVKVYPVETNSSLIARGSFVVGNAVKINFAMLKGSKGIFVMLPSEKDRNGKKDENGKDIYYPIAQFISAAARKELNDLAIAKYNEVKKGKSTGASTNGNRSNNVVDGLPF